MKGANLSNAELVRANLENANLENANLENSNLHLVYLRSANLKEANLQGANLDTSYLFKADLVDAVLDAANLYHAYLVGADLRNVSIRGANLRASINDNANFENANFEGASFENSRLSGANFRNTNLTNTLFKRSQVLGTNFEKAILTGACIEDWNINSKTNLQDLQCDYIYLKFLYSAEKTEKNFSKRRPHDPNKIFAPGEFTQLFQKALETVDLIFSEGIEWTAFLDSFQQLQAEVKSEELSIQAIEKKSGGVFVVRLEVPQEANKAEIEKYIRQEYDTKVKVIEANYQKQLQLKNETIEAKNETIQELRQKGTDMLEVARIMSSFQQNTIINNSPNMTPGNIYNTENAGILHNEKGNISENAKVGGKINEDGQPK